MLPKNEWIINHLFLWNIWSFHLQYYIFCGVTTLWGVNVVPTMAVFIYILSIQKMKYVSPLLKHHMYVINGCFIVPWEVWGSNFAMGLNTSVLGYINNTVSYIPLAVAVLFWLYPLFTDKGPKKKRMRPWDRPARTFILPMLAICAIDAMIIELCNTRKHLQKNKLKCKSCPLWKCLILKVQKLH